MSKSDYYVKFVFTLACLGIGYTIVMFLICTMFELLSGLVGVFVGYLVGNIVYNLEIPFFQSSDPGTVYWITILLLVFISHTISKYIQPLIYIVATSLMGSFALVRVILIYLLQGLSIFFKGFPDESYVMSLIKHKEYSQIQLVIN